MLKYPSIIGGMITLLVIGLILTACGGAATPEATTAPAQTEEVTSASPSVEPTATKETRAIAEPNVAATEEVTSSPAQAECNPVNPTEDITGFVYQYNETTSANKNAAPASDADWVKGPANAPVTIIEYGDFQ